jgi:hypothetical protein
MDSDSSSFLARNRGSTFMCIMRIEAKFWLEPAIELAQNYGLNDRQIRAAEELVRIHEHDIRAAWRKHFGR